MNNIEPNDPLKSALHQWKVQEPLPPRFQEQVWKRIEQAEVLKSRSWFAELRAAVEQLFSRPAFAYAYVAALLVIGLTGGYMKGQEKQSRLDAQLAARYVQSVDPYYKIDR